jgi:hypothetical protein
MTNFSKLLAVSVVVLSFSCGMVSQAGASIGSQGGTVKLESGLELSVPAGALSDDTAITVREVRGAEGEREIELEPRGTSLITPATVSVPDDVAGEVEAFEVEHGQQIAHRRGGGRVEIEVVRFERLHLGHVRHGADDSRDGGAEVEQHGGADDSADAGTEVHHGADDLDAGPVATTGQACVVDDTCACGSDCVSGQCTVVVACTTDAECTGGARCREARRSGAACGVSVCHL